MWIDCEEGWVNSRNVERVVGFNKRSDKREPRFRLLDRKGDTIGTAYEFPYEYDVIPAAFGFTALLFNAWTDGGAGLETNVDSHPVIAWRIGRNDPDDILPVLFYRDDRLFEDREYWVQRPDGTVVDRDGELFDNRASWEREQIRLFLFMRAEAKNHENSAAEEVGQGVRGEARAGQEAHRA